MLLLGTMMMQLRRQRESEAVVIMTALRVHSSGRCFGEGGREALLKLNCGGTSEFLLTATGGHARSFL